MAAVSSAFGRAGWRLLQLRCLPGKGAAEPGSGVERGGGARPTWAGCGAEEAVAAAREQGEVKDTGAGPPASREGTGRLAGLLPRVNRCEGPEPRSRASQGLSLPFNGLHGAPERAVGAQGHTARGCGTWPQPPKSPARAQGRNAGGTEAEATGGSTLATVSGPSSPPASVIPRSPATTFATLEARFLCVHPSS